MKEEISYNVVRLKRQHDRVTPKCSKYNKIYVYLPSKVIRKILNDGLSRINEAKSLIIANYYYNINTSISSSVIQKGLSLNGVSSTNLINNLIEIGVLYQNKSNLNMFNIKGVYNEYKPTYNDCKLIKYMILSIDCRQLDDINNQYINDIIPNNIEKATIRDVTTYSNQKKRYKSNKDIKNKVFKKRREYPTKNNVKKIKQEVKYIDNLYILNISIILFR